MRTYKTLFMFILTAILIFPAYMIGSSDPSTNEGNIITPTREGELDFQVIDETMIPSTTEKPLNSTYFIPIPEGSTVLSASASVSVKPLTDEGDEYPNDAWINVAGRSKEYIFNNEEVSFQGAWGRNYQSSDGLLNTSEFTTSSGSEKVRFSLPKNASITSATFNITGYQRAEEIIETNVSGITAGSHFGEVIRVLGDTNNAGSDEVLVSAPMDSVGAGRVYYLYIDTLTDHVRALSFASISQSNANFGASISGVFNYHDSVNDYIAIGAPSDQLNKVGSVRVYQYRANMGSSVVDIMIIGNNTGDLFGSAIEAADLNDDGETELIIGAPDAEGGLGVVYVFSIDSTGAKLYTAINGSSGEEHYGKDISVGDMNGDGIDDVAVASDSYVRVYLGGSTIDVIADAKFDPVGDSGQQGGVISSMKFMGDTGPGLETLAVGIPISVSGAVVIYNGGSTIDTIMDLKLVPGVRVEEFGSSIGFGDMDNDNINEIIVGSSYSSGGANVAKVFKRSSSSAWKDVPTKGNVGDRFSYSVGIADLRGHDDIFGDVIIGAPQFIGSSTSGPGKIYHFDHFDISTLPSNSPFISINGNTVWTYQEDHLYSTVTSGDVSASINSYLSSTSPDYNSDHEGFVYIDILFGSLTSLNIERSNRFRVSGYDIRYDETILFDDMTSDINTYINLELGIEKKIEIDGKTHIMVPFTFSAATPGRIYIDTIYIELDEIPYFEDRPDIIHVLEDSFNDNVLDLYSVFSDDLTADPYLNISVTATGTDSKFINLYIKDHRYLAVDLTYGPDTNGDKERDNANWTGTIPILFTVIDDIGGRFISPLIDLTVDGVNDAPAISQDPPRIIGQDDLFTYSPGAVDDELDDINYTLDMSRSPENMSIDHEFGTVIWRPGPWDVGMNNWSLVLSDGVDERRYTFSLDVNNEPDDPIFVSPAPVVPDGVLVGSTFEYQFRAVDPDPGDRLTYIIVFPVQGAGIEIQTGLFTWTPSQHYPEPVEFVIRARDPEGASADLSFTLNTTFIDNPPDLVDHPDTVLFDTREWVFPFQLIDPEEHRIVVKVLEAPEGLEYSLVTQNITWTPSVTQIGSFNLSMEVTSTNFIIYFNYTLEVIQSPRDWTFTLEGLETGQTFKGSIQIGGELVLTPSEIEKVLIRIGEGEWMEATFAEGRWAYDLDTTKFEDGEYTIQIRAFDGAVYSNTESITVTFKNEVERTSPLIYILIAFIILILIGLIVGGFLLFRRAQSKKEEAEVKARQEEALNASKRSMDVFLEETGSDLDSNIDYSSLDLTEQDAEGKDMSQIDEIFQPLNIPNEELQDSDFDIPEDPLSNVAVSESVVPSSEPFMGESMQIEDIEDVSG